MSTTSPKDAELLAAYEAAYDAFGLANATPWSEPGTHTWADAQAAGLRAVAAAAWDEGEDAGRRSIPRPNPYANALVATKEDQ